MALRPIAAAGAIVVSVGLVIAAGPVVAPSLISQDYSVLADSENGSPVDSFRFEKPFPGLDAEALRALVDAFFGDQPVIDAPPPDVETPRVLAAEIPVAPQAVSVVEPREATSLSRGVAVQLAAAVPDPTGQLGLVKQVQAFLDGGATRMAGRLLLRNLEEGTFEYGLVDAFFFGYPSAHAGPGADAPPGILSAAYFILDRLTQPRAAVATPEPPLSLDEGPVTGAVGSVAIMTDVVATAAVPGADRPTPEVAEPAAATPSPDDGERPRTNRFNVVRSGLNATPGATDPRLTAGRSPGTDNRVAGALQSVADAIQRALAPKPTVNSTTVGPQAAESPATADGPDGEPE